MCSIVHFTYRCGCVESTTFECPSHRRRHRYGLFEFVYTALDEDCHDCSGNPKSPCSVPVGILCERSLNVPTPRPPTPVTGEDMGTFVGVGLLEWRDDFASYDAYPDAVLRCLATQQLEADLTAEIPL
ncbi:hypothetical protein F5Y05DRAFT_421858 [Hypoxylon sp. FL0543]|nr:hypothetical protein F5Y05DRAFT_421858 [Hypoxylon sp. FL0543]